MKYTKTSHGGHEESGEVHVLLDVIFLGELSLTLNKGQ